MKFSKAEKPLAAMSTTTYLKALHWCQTTPITSLPSHPQVKNVSWQHHKPWDRNLACRQARRVARRTRVRRCGARWGCRSRRWWRGWSGLQRPRKIGRCTPCPEWPGFCLSKAVKTLLARSARYAPVNVGSFLGVVPCCPTDLASPAAVVVTILWTRSWKTCLDVNERQLTCMQVHRRLQPVFVHPAERSSQEEERVLRVVVVGVWGGKRLAFLNWPVPDNFERYGRSDTNQ